MRDSDFNKFYLLSKKIIHLDAKSSNLLETF